MSLLTIAIPTYNRADTSFRCAERALQVSEGLPIKVVVFDNASSDNTADLMSQLRNHPDFSYVRSDRNFGLAGQYDRMSQSVTTNFVYVLSDEDDLAGVAELKILLSHLRSHQPALTIEPKVHKPLESLTSLEPQSLWRGLSYVSGTTFSLDAMALAHQRVSEMRENIDIDYLWSLYPQVVLGFAVWLSGAKCTQIDVRTFSMTRARQPTLADVQEYSSLQGRLRQLSELAAMIETMTLSNNAPSRQIRKACAKWYESRLKTLFLHEVRTNAPNLVPFARHRFLFRELLAHPNVRRR